MTELPNRQVPVAAPPPTVPDGTDWAAVLQGRCPECGFEAGRLERDHVAGRFRATVPRWTAALRRPQAAIRGRPAPTVWSPLEYACHVRDVARLFERRLALMLSESDPVLVSWDQDEAAVTGRYWQQNPQLVCDQLGAATMALASSYDAVQGPAWERPGRRSDGSAFTVESLAAYALHELEHHLHDVGA